MSAVGLTCLVPLSLAGIVAAVWAAPLLALLLITLWPGRAVPAHWVLFSVSAGAAAALLIGWPWQSMPTIALAVLAVWWLRVRDRTDSLRQVSRRWLARPDLTSTLVSLASVVISAAFLIAYFQVTGQFAFLSLPGVALVLIPLGNAVLEEVVWRGAILGLLLEAGLRARYAVGLQALSFGVAHWQSGIPSGPLGAVASALLGLALGVVAHRSGSLALPIAVHWVVDMVIFFSLFR